MTAVISRQDEKIRFEGQKAGQARTEVLATNELSMIIASKGRLLLLYPNCYTTNPPSGEPFTLKFPSRNSLFRFSHLLILRTLLEFRATHLFVSKKCI